MATTATKLTGEEVMALGTALYERHIKPLLRPEDHGKIVAIDVHSGDYEVHDDLNIAANTLHARRPEGEFWGERAGHPFVYAHVTPFFGNPL